MKRIIVLLPVIAALLLLVFTPVIAQNDHERILKYHSDIVVHENASLTVTETITVRALGDKIRQGIYRDFPTLYTTKFGTSYKVGFDILSVKRNGVNEPYHTEPMENGERIYIGKKGVYLAQPADYVYEIQYRTDRQLGFYKDFDELYWNVTGNGWEFEILESSAAVTLPKGAAEKIRSVAGYTGAQGSKEESFRQWNDPSGVIRFAANRKLGANEGFTIAVSWPKGFVREPDAPTKTKQFIGDNIGGLLGFGGIIVIILYYLVVWFMVGRDPAKGVIVPRFEPPANMSPAAMRYTDRMGYDNTVMAAALINCAVKGHITISETDGEFSITRKESKNELSLEEERLLDNLAGYSGGRGEFVFTQSDHARISDAIKQFKALLEKKYERTYFFRNIRHFTVGTVISGAAIFLAGLSMSTSRGSLPIFLFMCVWLSGWTTGVSFLLHNVYKAWKAAIHSGFGLKGLAEKGGALFQTLFAIPFIAGEIFGVGILVTYTSYMMIPIVLMIGGLNYLFYHLLKAPTLMGRKVMDEIDGFKMFLTMVETDRLQRMVPDGKATPELFERYLPHALALGVEQEWAERFAGVLAEAAAAPQGTYYSPSWYSGRTFSSTSMGSFSSSLGSALSGAISSSSTAPGRSGGGGSSGGGSSGGGGGGGGGGGW